MFLDLSSTDFLNSIFTVSARCCSPIKPSPNGFQDESKQYVIISVRGTSDASTCLMSADFGTRKLLFAGVRSLSYWVLLLRRLWNLVFYCHALLLTFSCLGMVQSEIIVHRGIHSVAMKMFKDLLPFLKVRLYFSVVPLLSQWVYSIMEKDGDTIARLIFCCCISFIFLSPKVSFGFLVSVPVKTFSCLLSLFRKWCPRDTKLRSLDIHWELAWRVCWAYCCVVVRGSL